MNSVAFDMIGPTLWKEWDEVSRRVESRMDITIRDL
jgi:hypothetical protein